jgi:hypothetical protein
MGVLRILREEPAREHVSYVSQTKRRAVLFERHARPKPKGSGGIASRAFLFLFRLVHPQANRKHVVANTEVTSFVPTIPRPYATTFVRSVASRKGDLTEGRAGYRGEKDPSEESSRTEALLLEEVFLLLLAG